MMRILSSTQEPLNRLQNIQNQGGRFGRNVVQRGPVIHDPFTPPVTAAKIRGRKNNPQITQITQI
jgi:hypothetical protein